MTARPEIYRLATVRAKLDNRSDSTIRRFEERGIIPKRRRLPNSKSVYWIASEFDAALSKLTGEIGPNES